MHAMKKAPLGVGIVDAKTVRLNLVISPAMKAEIEDAAHAARMSASEYIRRAIIAKLEGPRRKRAGYIADCPDCRRESRARLSATPAQAASRAAKGGRKA